MRRLLGAVIGIALISAADRLPAPILEEPTPAATATPAKKSSPKATAKESKHVVEKKSAVPLGGAWDGAINFTCLLVAVVVGRRFRLSLGPTVAVFE